MNLQEFIEKYESDAMILDLTKEELPNRILQTQIFKFNNAEFESERIEVKEFVKKAIKELKHRLQLSINNESYKTKYKGFTAPYLLDIRLLIEYRKLIKFLEEYESDTKDRTKVNLDLKDFLVNPLDEDKVIKEVAFEELFKNPENANLSLNKLKEVFPDLLSDDYSYIKGTKGIFPMFIQCLRELELINNHSDIIYKNALNSKIKNLNLSKDASEFRKNYSSLKDSERMDLKLSLSQISH